MSYTPPPPDYVIEEGSTSKGSDEGRQSRTSKYLDRSLVLLAIIMVVGFIFLYGKVLDDVGDTLEIKSRISEACTSNGGAILVGQAMDVWFCRGADGDLMQVYPPQEIPAEQGEAS